MMPARAQADLAVTFVEPARKEFKSLQGSMTSRTVPSSIVDKALHFVHLLEKNSTFRGLFFNF